MYIIEKFINLVDKIESICIPSSTYYNSGLVMESKHIEIEKMYHGLLTVEVMPR